MARYEGRHRSSTPEPTRRRKVVLPGAAVMAGAVAWGVWSNADGATGTAATQVRSAVSGGAADTNSRAADSRTAGDSATTVAQVKAATKARADARAAAVSRANADRTQLQQRATALRALTRTTTASPYAGTDSTNDTAAGNAGGAGQQATTTSVIDTATVGGFTCPIAGCGGTFTSGFGHRASPGGIGSTEHMGIDLATPIGTPLRALHGGTVTAVGWYGGQGKRITMDIGGGVTIVYAHMSSFGVSVGQQVEAGQLVGFSGNTGNSTGAHLHLEVHIGDVPINPVGWLRAHGIAV